MKHVVIVGGGFAGLNAAKRLGKTMPARQRGYLHPQRCPRSNQADLGPGTYWKALEGTGTGRHLEVNCEVINARLTSGQRHVRRSCNENASGSEDGLARGSTPKETSD